MKKLKVVGMGMGAQTVTVAGMEAIRNADILMGAPRMVAEFADLHKKTASAYTPE